MASLACLSKIGTIGVYQLIVNHIAAKFAVPVQIDLLFHLEYFWLGCFLSPRGHGCSYASIINGLP